MSDFGEFNRGSFDAYTIEGLKSELAKANAKIIRMDEAGAKAAEAFWKTREEVEKLRKDIDWIRQTIHRGYHDGSLEECRKNTCTYARQLIK